jgi:serine/threonine-protein kinase RsbW
MTKQMPPRPARTGRGPVDLEGSNYTVQFDMEIPGVPAAISEAVEQVLALAKRAGCATGKEFEIETALREALANAIRYGCAHNPDKVIQLSAACDEARGMLIVVRDPGPGFDPSQVPSPVEGDQIYSSHGRGIFLITQLMDHVEYGRGGTEIRMLKR